MAALLKNQILKHLSKFTKNLSADKINLSTLKGEGELSNLELNEDILTQLLELPTWLRITKAVCNRVAVKIQWTKLKSQPICLYLDEIIVETETCEQPRPPNSQAQQTAAGKYGFVDRVMDGIYIHVNSVVVKLHSHKFHASLQLSRVKVQSMSPTWQTPSELRSTRIRDAARGEVLLFKEIEWQTTRIEATAVGLDDDFLTPLRLIANQAKIRICVKKRLSDCAIISSRLALLLDDLLWVLTITQLKAAILYANSLKELIERSAQQSKKLAAEKLKKQGHMSESSQNHQQQQQRLAPDRQESTTAKYFSRFDVISTSYHLITSRFDLHLCDDSSPAEEAERHWKINGGSMQITFYKLSIDFYPFHPADTDLIMTRGGERKSWYRYTDNIGSRNPWVNKLFTKFRDEAVKLRKVCESSPMPSSSSAPSLLVPQVSPTQRKTLSPATTQSVSTSPVHSMNQPSRSVSGTRSAQASPVHHVPAPKSTRLLESCFVVKVEDVTVYMVSMPGKKRTGSNKLLCSDKRQLHLPPDMSVIHVEFTDYFFPEGLDYPVPHANLYVLVNPIRMTLDFLTLLWSNVFLLTLSNSLDMDFGEQGPPEHVDVKVELLLPRVILPAEEKVEGQPDRPDAVQLQISKLVVTNRRLEEKMSRDDLKTTIDQYERAKLFTSPDFPNDGTVEKREIIPELMSDHAADKDNPYIDKAVKYLLGQMVEGVKLSPSGGGVQDSNQPCQTHRLTCNSLKRLATSDIWSASAEQVWLDFLGVQNCKNRPASFVEALPVTVWLSATPNTAQCHQFSADSSSHVSDNAQKTAHALSQRDQNGEYSKQGSHQDGPPTNTPVLGSSPPGPDRAGRLEDHLHTYSSSSHPNDKKDHSHVNKHHSNHPDSTDPCLPEGDHNGDGNSFSSSHQQYRSYTDDLHPSRGHSNDGSCSNKNQTQPDHHHDIDTLNEPISSGYSSAPKKSYSKRDGRYHPSDQDYGTTSDFHKRGRSSAEYGPRNVSESHTNKTNADQEDWQRREMRFRREDSRSSSSPPLLQTEPGSHKREELKEKRSKEKRQRHSSSSSSDRRDVDGGKRKNREYDGRCYTEGQVNSNFSRSGEDRLSLKDIKRKEDYYTTGDADKTQMINRRGREDEIPQREVHGQGFRRSRYSSSSGSDIASTGSRDRRQPRSGSRDSRGNMYERYMEEIEKYPVRERHRGEREKSSREEAERQLSKETHMRRSTRDGSRESSGDRYDRSDGHCFDRSSVRSKKRDQMDGIPSCRHDLSPDQTSVGARVSDKQHRSSSRGRDTDVRSHRHEHAEHGDSYRTRHHSDEPDYRSRLEESARPRYTDADCDNDRFSHTSHSSQDTLGRDSSQDVVTSEQRPTDLDYSKQLIEGPSPWPENSTDWAQSNKRLPPEGCKSQDDVCPHQEINKEHPRPKPDRKICVLAKVCGKLRIQINHFQYLFLLRLSESFLAFQTDLSADLLSISSTSKKSALKKSLKPQPSSFIVIPLVLKELEFAVVCPYQMHQRTFSDDFSVVSPFLQGMTAGHDAVFGDDGDGICFPHLTDNIKGQRSKDDASLKPFQPVITFKSNSSNQLDSMSHLGQSLDTGQRTKGFTSTGSSTAMGHHPVPVISGPAPFGSTDSKKDIDVMSQSLNSIGKDSGIGVERKPLSQKQHQSRGGGSGGRGSGGKGASDMKKAFTSAFSSLTDKLKNKMESLDDNFGADDDTVSIRTDTSDDDFEHLSLDDAEEVPAFFHDPPPPDVASAGDNYSETGDPGDSVSMYAESSTTKGKEMVYVVLFKLDHTEMLLENGDDQTVAKVQLAKLSTIQLGNISYEDFQTRFQTAKGYLQEDVSNTPPSRYPICLNFETHVPDPCLGLAVDPGCLTVRANDFSLQFKMSGLTCLSDFSEDEKQPEFMPLSVEITNFLLVLEEDRPSASVTSPGAVPVNIHIQRLSVERGKDGIVYISSNPGNTPLVRTTTPAPAPPKPDYINAVTSPIMSPDGTMALLMASQNEAVLLRRQLEEVRRANRLYEHQILQWRDMQDNLVGRRPGVGGTGLNQPRGSMTKRQSFTADSLSNSPSSTGHLDIAAGQSRFPQDDVDPARDELECENLQLQQRLARLEDDLLTVSKEKESLLQTLQLLQDELLASERKHRSKLK